MQSRNLQIKEGKTSDHWFVDLIMKDLKVEVCKLSNELQ